MREGERISQRIYVYNPDSENNDSVFKTLKTCTLSAVTQVSVEWLRSPHRHGLCGDSVSLPHHLSPLLLQVSRQAQAVVWLHLLSHRCGDPSRFPLLFNGCHQ